MYFFALCYCPGATVLDKIQLHYRGITIPPESLEYKIRPQADIGSCLFPTADLRKRHSSISKNRKKKAQKKHRRYRDV